MALPLDSRGFILIGGVVTHFIQYKLRNHCFFSFGGDGGGRGRNSSQEHSLEPDTVGIFPKFQSLLVKAVSKVFSFIGTDIQTDI